MDRGVETITDEHEKAALRKQASGVKLRAVAAAVASAVAVYLVP
jgi:hypothetical protein